MIHHVYDIRTYEILFYNENYDECIKYIKRNKNSKYLRIYWTFKNNIRSGKSEI